MTVLMAALIVIGVGMLCAFVASTISERRMRAALALREQEAVVAHKRERDLLIREVAVEAVIRTRRETRWAEDMLEAELVLAR